MCIFAKQVTCRRTNGIKLNNHPNCFSRDIFLDAYEMCVGSTYTITQNYYCKITGTPFGHIEFELVTLKEFPGQAFLRSAFSE
jgi:hypothetical protein